MMKNTITEVAKYLLVQIMGGILYFFFAFSIKQSNAWVYTVIFVLQVLIYGYWSNSWSLNSLRVRPFLLLLRNIGIGLILVVIFCIVFSFLEDFTISADIYKKMIQFLRDGTIAFLLIVAFLEELFFRGKLFEIINSKNAMLAIGVTALLFSLFHYGDPRLAHYNNFKLGYMLFFGGFIGIVRYYTKSIYSCFTFHFLTNVFIVSVG